METLLYLELFLLLKNPDSIPFPMPLPSLDLLVAVELLGYISGVSLLLLGNGI